jgi:gamma-butyrobetaine dioxygenase
MELTSFHPLWLRDNCPCPECRHASGQRLVDVRSFPDDLHVVSVDGTEVRFSDGHVSHFEAGSIVAEAPRAPRLWDASLPVERFAWDDLRGWLASVDELGFALVTGAPAEPGTVLRAAERFGFVRETNYGRLFDVKVVVDPTNLAYTSLGLGAHTDNPYRDPVPTLQLLHCIESSAEGGESTLVDGFRVARDLPDGDFALLAGTPVSFRYADADTELASETTVLELDARGEVRAVHFNTRSARLPPTAPAGYYEAYRRFGRMLELPEYRIEVKLGPGDLVVMDNERVLHGRSAYAATGGARWLQGCYADRDGLRSMLAVVSR